MPMLNARRLDQCSALQSKAYWRHPYRAASMLRTTFVFSARVPPSGSKHDANGKIISHQAPENARHSSLLAG